MARRYLHGAPYAAVGALLDWANQPGRWQLFDGWCTAQGVDPTSESLPAWRALNLLHYYIASSIAPEKRQELTNLVTGPLTSYAPKPAPAAPGQPAPLKPPPWWKGDATASRNTLAAQREVAQAIASL